MRIRIMHYDDNVNVLYDGDGYVIGGRYGWYAQTRMDDTRRSDTE